MCIYKTTLLIWFVLFDFHLSNNIKVDLSACISISNIKWIYGKNNDKTEC